MNFLKLHWQRVVAGTTILLAVIGFFSNVFGLYDHFFPAESSLSGVKQETSQDPRKELQNLGVPWEHNKLFRAILDQDSRIATLFVAGGMKMDKTEFAFFTDAQIDGKDRYDETVASEILKHHAANGADVCPHPEILKNDASKYFFFYTRGDGLRPRIYATTIKSGAPNKRAFIKAICAVPPVLDAIKDVVTLTYKLDKGPDLTDSSANQLLQDWRAAYQFLSQ
jgi:hypothetical protein